MGKIKRVLIRTPNWIGDTVMATPLISVLADSFPQARIDLLAPSRVAELLQHHPSINHIHFYNNQSLKEIGLWKKLRAEKYDLGISLPNSFKSAWQLWLAGAEKRLGYDTDGRKILLTHSLPRDRAARELHQTVYYLKILSLLGISLPKSPPRPEIYLTGREKAWGADFVKRSKTAGSHPVITIAPGSSKPERCWHTDRLISLIGRLIEEYEADVILLGGPGEKGLLEEIKKGVGIEKRVKTVSDLNLRRVAAVINESSLLISNNSGLIHLAAAVESRLVAVFGPGSPQVTSPYPLGHPSQTIVYHKMDCSPCRERFFKDCRSSESNKPLCLESITVEEVFEAVKAGIQNLSLP